MGTTTESDETSDTVLFGFGIAATHMDYDIIRNNCLSDVKHRCDPSARNHSRVAGYRFPLQAKMYGTAQIYDFYFIVFLASTIWEAVTCDKFTYIP